jgi:hypothetical protein
MGGTRTSAFTAWFNLRPCPPHPTVDGTSRYRGLWKLLIVSSVFGGLAFICTRWGALVTELRDSIYYAQLARKARQLASAHSDPIAARHLRETALKHERRARQLARAESYSLKSKRSLRDFLPFL